MDRTTRSSSSEVRPFGLSGGFKRGAQALVVSGVALIATGLFATVALASTVQQPTLTATRATFEIKASNPSTVTWELSLWEMTNPQKYLGSDKGTSGLLMVRVPATSSCYFQVDVTRNGVFYSGFRRTIAFCGGVSVSSTSSSSSSSSSTSPSSTIPVSSVPVSSTPTTSKGSTTSSTMKTSVHPATKDGSGGSGSSGKGGSGSGTSPTSVPSSKLAFTGAGFALTLLAIFGALLLISGAGLLIYARRYPRSA
jgi:hypothetical protein